MDVDESALLKKFVDGEREGVADAEDGAEGVATDAEVRNLAQELHRVALLLEWIDGGVGGAIDLQLASFELHRLARARRGDQLACDADACACRSVGQRVFGDGARFDYHLQILERGAVV